MARDNQGRCALHYACANNNLKCAKQLIIECDIQDNDGKTPLDIAKLKGNLQIVAMLEDFIIKKPR